MKTIGVIKERGAQETRVSLTPQVAGELVRAGLEVLVEGGAGLQSGYSDEDYQLAGAKLVWGREELIERSDTLLAIEGASFSGIAGGQKTLIALFDPHRNKDQIRGFKEQGATLIALEFIPRISRAQSMDVLSSQANLAGYVAMLLASTQLPKVLPLLMTAAGTIKAAHVLVLGAGVAGLQAIATARRLGAVVYAYDVRSAVKEQVESLGAKFVAIALKESGEGSGGYAKALSPEAMLEQRALLTAFAKDMDVIITTAQIPGQKAPRLLDDVIFSTVKEGSVIIDMAAASGGNVAHSQVNEWQKQEKAFLYGGHELSRKVPHDASFTFSKNIKALLLLIKEKGELDVEDDILREAVLCSGQRWINQNYAASMAQTNKGVL